MFVINVHLVIPFCDDQNVLKIVISLEFYKQLKSNMDKHIHAHNAFCDFSMFKEMMCIFYLGKTP